MADRIETTDELRIAVRAAAVAGHFDVRVETTVLRESWNVAGIVSDQEIHRIVTDTLRTDENPEVVFTLGGGLIVAQVYVPVNGDYSIGDELWRVEHDLSKVHGERIRLAQVHASECGYGILTAYRMPVGDYRAQDWPLVERFGVERGKYRQSPERVAAQTAIEHRTASSGSEMFSEAPAPAAAQILH